MGHLAFKTQDVTWLNTALPVVVLVSVHSALHDGAEGFLKMEAFMSTIKSCVAGKISIVIADTAHLQARSLTEGDLALDGCLEAGEELVLRYQSLFSGCEVLYWHAFSQEVAYAQIRSGIVSCMHADGNLQELLLADAEITYTEKRALECPDKESFLKATLADLLEQCVVLQLLNQQGYRYLFYPGAPCQATEYLHKILNSELKWVDVFLTIEKKTRSPLSLTHSI